MQKNKLENHVLVCGRSRGGREENGFLFTSNALLIAFFSSSLFSHYDSRLSLCVLLEIIPVSNEHMIVLMLEIQGSLKKKSSKI